MVPDDTLRIASTLAVVALVVLAGCAGGLGSDGSPEPGTDDAAANGANGDNVASNGMENGANGDDGLGYTPGGAQDVNNFRDNVESGHLPIRSDVTHEGLYSEYYFESDPGECEELFCPAYSRAVTADPLSNETEQYLSVGLNSNLDADEFERERLNLVVVLDVSGSMGSGMASYHYDPDSDEERGTETTPRMDAATDATIALLDQLEDEDRFGLVTFDDRAETRVPLDRVGDRDEGQLREDIDSIRAGGGTNLAAGMDEARQEIAALEDDDAETRVVYLTDAQPNEGDTTRAGFENRLADDADDGIHSTFVGVGMDFNSGLVDSITSVRGANYYSVHSAERFEERMGEEFEYMVTPMVFDLELDLESDAYDIEAVYGSQEADAATGELLSVKTLFPSPTENGSTKGGVVLAKLDDAGGNGTESVQAGGNATLDLTVRYEDREGGRHETTETVSFETDEEHFDDEATRKAVALARYATLMQNWIDYERATLAEDDPDPPGEGIEEAPEPDLGTWERQSADLQVSPTYAERIDAFASAFADEVDAVGDESMERELDVMETILEESDLELDAENPDGTENESATDEAGNESETVETGNESETDGDAESDSEADEAESNEAPRVVRVG